MNVQGIKNLGNGTVQINGAAIPFFIGQVDGKELEKVATDKKVRNGTEILGAAYGSADVT